MAARIEARACDSAVAASKLLSAVTSGFSIAREPRIVRQRFEEELRTLVRAQSVAVRECSPEVVLSPEVVSLEVPAPPWGTPRRLEAVFEPQQQVDDWKRHTLSVGAHVAALLMELEQADGRWVRFRRTDGAAPLIGSSGAVRAIRDRIERVALTDFTVLIEGGFGPQPHCGFIEVFG